MPFEWLAQRDRVHGARGDENDVATFAVLGRRDHQRLRGRPDGTRRRRQVQTVEALAHRRDVDAVDDEAHLFARLALRMQGDGDYARGDDEHAGFDPLGRWPDDAPDRAEQPSAVASLA